MQAGPSMPEPVILLSDLSLLIYLNNNVKNNNSYTEVQV